MHDAGLHLGLREGGGDGLGEAPQPVDNRDQNVIDAPVAQFVHDPQSEFGPFGLFHPQAERLLMAVGPHAKSKIDSLVLHRTFVASLRPP